MTAQNVLALSTLLPNNDLSGSILLLGSTSTLPDSVPPSLNISPNCHLALISDVLLFILTVMFQSLRGDSKVETSSAHLGGADPPSYGQTLGSTHIEGSLRAPQAVAGTYVFKAINETITTVELKGEDYPPIFHILKEPLPLSPLNMITIRQGSPGAKGKVVLAFEAGGRELTVFHGKIIPRWSLCRMTHTPLAGAGMVWNPGTPHKWAVEVRSGRLLCSSFSQSKHKEDSAVYATYTPANKLFALVDPQRYLSDPELEVKQEGVEGLDMLISSLVLLLFSHKVLHGKKLKD
ncbi:hypothetical protein DL96DRAFT_1612422 [Flagelloscypha sp. PMI_526]|nr:hypothetical protein DL96DRAFT_1612422 [Flagelloscypha sp. PMI_526]